jgi:hypothetical protein
MQNMSGMASVLNWSIHTVKTNDLKRIERAICGNTDIIINRWYEIFGQTDNSVDDE